MAVLLLLPLAPAQPQDPPRKLTDDEKIELLRGLTAEYVTLKVYLPRSRKALRFNSDGSFSYPNIAACADELAVIDHEAEVRAGLDLLLGALDPPRMD